MDSFRKINWFSNMERLLMAKIINLKKKVTGLYNISKHHPKNSICFIYFSSHMYLVSQNKQQKSTIYT